MTADIASAAAVGMNAIDVTYRRANLINFSAADVKYNNSPFGCVPGKTSQAIKNVFSVITYCVSREKEKKNVLQLLLRGTTMDNRNLRLTVIIIINRLTWLCGETFFFGFYICIYFFAFIPYNNNNDLLLADCPCSVLNGQSKRTSSKLRVVYVQWRTGT